MKCDLKPVSTLFEEQVAKKPDSVALIQGNQTLTYSQLNSRANRLAVYLRNRGVVPESLVGIYMPQSIDAVVAVMGILKAGGAYVPLAVSNPPERTEEIVRDGPLSIVVSLSHLRRELGDAAPVASLDQDLPSNLNCDENLDLLTNLDSAAYVLYTSGSTGKPKGVIGIHRSIVNGLLSVDYASDERCCLNASLSFGLSLANLFLPLMQGVPLIVLSDEQIQDLGLFLNVLYTQRISRVVLLPPVFKRILEIPGAQSKLTKIREVGLAGAALTSSLIRRFAEVMPLAKLHNCYSASEIGTLATVWNVRPEDLVSEEVVIGRPVANTNIYLLDENLLPVRSGDVGEIYVSAPHLARGYLNQPDLTAQRFLSDPFHGGRMLRTGDLGRLRPDGEIEFLGRADEQVKIRGYRIELTEVERALSTHHHIQEAAAAAHEIGGDLRLVGYIVAKTQSTLTISDIRGHLSRTLPAFMIPSAFIFMDRLPLSRTGKVDRAALPPPGPERPGLGTPHKAPRNQIEAALTEDWMEILGLQAIGVDDHFMELGGDSLFATQVSARIIDRYGIEIDLEEMFASPTISKLATHIASLQKES